MKKISLGNINIIEGTQLPYSASTLLVNEPSGSFYIQHNATETSSSISLLTYQPTDYVFPLKNNWMTHGTTEHASIYVAIGNTTGETLSTNTWAAVANATWNQVTSSVHTSGTTSKLSVSSNVITVLPGGEGWYRIDYNGSFYGNGIGDDLMAVGISVNNGTPAGHTIKQTHHYDNNLIDNFSGSTILKLKANDNIRLAMKNINAADDIAIWCCMLTMNKIMNYITTGI